MVPAFPTFNNPRWQTTTILKTGKSLSLYLSNGSTYCHKICYENRDWSYLPYRPL